MSHNAKRSEQNRASALDGRTLEQLAESNWPRESWENEIILLAVSGGLDSMVLLDLYARVATDLDRVKVFHCNHGLRGEESEQDEAFVLEQSLERGVECLSVQLDTSPGKRYSEEKLRQLRYYQMKESAAALHARWVVLGHHRDDDVETFFIRLLRGTGIQGLGGIPAERSFSVGRWDATYVRPFLTAPRSLILGWAEQFNVPFREDSSNALDLYFRNRIRNELLPAVDQAGQPDWRDKVTALMSEVVEMNDDIQEEVERLLSDPAVSISGIGSHEQVARFPIGLFFKGPWFVFRAFLVELWHRQSWGLQGMTRKHWQSIRDLLNESLTDPHPKRLSLPGKLDLEVRKGTVSICRRPSVSDA